MASDLDTIRELLEDRLTPTERLVKVVTGLSEPTRARHYALEAELLAANGSPEPRVALLLLFDELVEQDRPAFDGLEHRRT